MFSKEKPNTAFVIHGLSMGGAEKFLIYLVNKLKREGYMPIIISLSNDMALLDEVDKDIRVITVLRKYKFDITIISEIRKIIIDNHIEKIFCINMFSFFFAKLGFLFNKKIQFYISLHSTIPVSYKGHIANYIYFRFVQRRDRVIYICRNQQKYLKRTYTIRSICDDVIYNGINTSYFDPSLFGQFNVQEFRKQFGIQENELVILKVARLRVEKGHADAIKALAILHQQYGVKAHLMFVGTGDQVFIKRLKELAKNQAVDEFIHYPGIQADVRKYYLSSTIFTLTSHSIETFSLAALEAMAFSLPCSLTNIGGASEMIYKGINGDLTRPNDPFSIAESWNKLLNRPFDKNEIRDIVINNFSSDKMLKHYINLLEKNIIYNN